MHKQDQYRDDPSDQATEQRFGEAAYAYDHRRDTGTNARRTELQPGDSNQLGIEESPHDQHGGGTVSADHGPTGTVNTGDETYTNAQGEHQGERC